VKNDAILLIDAGNSNIKWNMYRADNGLIGADTVSYAYKMDNVFQRLDAFIQEYRQTTGAIKQAVISNVAGDRVKCDLEQCLVIGNNVSINLVQTEKEFAGVQCAYARIENLGVDRWIGIISAAELYLSNSVLCIASCGTATTIDFLTPQKQHLGGIISCGANLIRQQLGRHTANIPAVAESAETTLFSSDTGSAVNSGARYAVAGMINTAVAQAQQQLGQNVQLLITGGGAQSVLPLLAGKIIQDTELLMKGLAIFASKKL